MQDLLKDKTGQVDSQLKSPAMARWHCQSLAACSTAEPGSLLWVRMTIWSQPEQATLILPLTTGLQPEEHCRAFHLGIISLAVHFMSKDRDIPFLLKLSKAWYYFCHHSRLDQYQRTRGKSDHGGNEGGGSASSHCLSLQH